MHHLYLRTILGLSALLLVDVPRYASSQELKSSNDDKLTRLETLNRSQKNDRFEKQVAPLLIKHCVECHNPTDKSGGLDLTTRTGLTNGGDSAEDLTDNDVDANFLFDRVLSGEMPPEEKGHSRKIPDQDIVVIREWIKSGASWPEKRELDLYEFTSDVRGGRDWWSLQPIDRPKVPRFSDLINPIDAFVRARQIEHELNFSPEASRWTLFRRLAFDVTGLPPNVDELRSFENDLSSDAYERLVDRLLASPRFGELLGRNWLDLVRYADTNGYERDAEKPNSWKYRDWVIESINSDKPYDRFVLQQLAGDQMSPLQEDNVVGTTMLRVGTWDDEPNDKLEYKYDRLEDLIHVTSTAFLGLTVKCSRCHNHKFDPIPQKDYYRMGSIFWPGDLMGNKSDPVKGFEVFAWSDSKKNVAPIRLLKKGNPRQPLDELDPGFLSVIPQLDSPFEKASNQNSDTGRRLEFARRLVDKRNPLVARVIVNRIWQHYFGYGIVRTPNNFGFKGDLPTHPKLLDWLASELMDNGWSLKPIHRLILTSRTYRQQSGNRSQSEKIIGQEVAVRDPLNFFLSRMNRKRLRAETIRDSMLSHASQLNLQMGGRGFNPSVTEEALEGLSRKSGSWQASSVDQQYRRGVYVFIKRSLIPPLLANFDFADTTRPCGKRDLTIVAPQALALLNNTFVHQQSELFASSVIDQSKELTEQIRLAWNRALARDPSSAEMDLAKKHYQDQWKYFSNANRRPDSVTGPRSRLPKERPVLHLDAGFNVQTDADGRVTRWSDRNELRFATPKQKEFAPRLVRNKIDGKSVIQFDGKKEFLEVNDQVIKSKEFSIVIVGYDQNKTGHREFFSNWNANGNSTTSVFLGLTDGRFVRFSDQFRSQKPVPQQPVILSAISGSQRTKVYVGQNLIGNANRELTGRRLDTRYVLGTQGNFGHEYLDGWIAELLVYNKALSEEELNGLVVSLGKKYPSAKTKKITQVESRPRTPELLAMASLCHVLLNSNENIFAD